MALTCDPVALVRAAACFAPTCIGPDDREAIHVHAMVQELNAIGGTDYRGEAGRKQLEIDAKAWQVIDEDTRRAVALYMDIQNAINKGASFATDINSLRTAARCYLCVPWEFRRAIRLYLKCQLNTRLAPE